MSILGLKSPSILRDLQAGDVEQAKLTWRSMLVLYGSQAHEARWCDLARHGLGELERKPPTPDAERQRAKQETLDRIQSLRMQGKQAEADEAIAAYRRIYGSEDDAESKPRE